MNVGPFTISNIGEMTSSPEVLITDLQLICRRNSTNTVTSYHRLFSLLIYYNLVHGQTGCLQI